MSHGGGPRRSASDALTPIERFRADLLATLGDTPTGPLALAVSGGADSMAMLALAHAAYPGGVIAATVDHRTRPDTDKEAAMVAEVCASLGITHRTLAGPEPLVGSDLQARARRLRYDLLARWAIGAGAVCLLTAHHADDQAETFLMRANRGCGPAGLAGIRARRVETVTDWAPGFPQGGVVSVAHRRDLLVLRPLLGWRRAELRAVADRLGWPVAEDPGNTDDRFERARVRRLLAATDALEPVQVARAAAHAAEAHDALDAMLEFLWITRSITPSGVDDVDSEAWINVAELPRELKRRMARSAIRYVRDVSGTTRPEFDEGANVEPLLNALEAGSSATHAGVLASAEGSFWRFREAPARRG